MARRHLVIAQLSDLHCGSAYFDPGLLDAAVGETLDAAPDLVVVGGDLTAEGYAQEFRTAEEHLRPLYEHGLNVVVVPGNHDAKNVGWVHFRDTFGPGDTPEAADRALSLVGGGQRVKVVAVDSSKPDLAEGEVGRPRYPWIRSHYDVDCDLKVFVVHHHLVPVPGTGRERSTLLDAGDVLALLTDCGVDLVLSGHKHVPHVWLLGSMLQVNSGTVSSHRLRGYTPSSYNLIEVTPDEVRVTIRQPQGDERVAAVLDRRRRALGTAPGPAGVLAEV